jgi:NADPH2 dehydrogenase
MQNFNIPLPIHSKLSLKNRVIVPPMASQTADKKGNVTNQTLQHYQRLIQSQASLVMVEYSYVHDYGKSESNQLGISSDEHISGLKKLAQIFHAAQLPAAIQLVHGGGKTERSITGGPLLAPSALPIPTRGEEMEIPDEANLNDVYQIKESFIEAAHRAFSAGFDWIELHAAHGYGLNQWLSPLTNKRTDPYGGTYAKRTRLLMEIAIEIRYLFPDIAISVRIPGQDYIEGGLTVNDSIRLAGDLEAIGINIINVSSGIGGWRRPRDKRGEGYLVSEAQEIKKHISIPVIGVGGISTTEYIQNALENSFFDLAAVGRAILQNPAWRVPS